MLLSDNPTATETRFDHAQAWRELIVPAFAVLPNEVRALYERIAKGEKTAQDSACRLTWPDDGGALRSAFETIDTHTLARAARVLNFYEHWSPKGHQSATGGAGWRFANFADQVLAARLAADTHNPHAYDRFARKAYGFSVFCIEGAARVAYEERETRFNGGGGWTWEDIGPFRRDVLRMIEDERAELGTVSDPMKIPEIIRSRVRPKLSPEDRELFGVSERFKITEGRCRGCHSLFRVGKLRRVLSLSGEVFICPDCYTRKPKPEPELHARICDECGQEWLSIHPARGGGRGADLCSWECVDKRKGTDRKLADPAKS